MSNKRSPAPAWLSDLRDRTGMSTADLARKAGLSRREVRRLERGTRPPSATEIDALAQALEVEPSVVRAAANTGPPPGTRFRAQDGAGDSDQLLREYISMVQELRDAQRIAPATLRQDDLMELAQALGGTPEAIEARLMELLDTDHEHAMQLRASIVPSW